MASQKTVRENRKPQENLWFGGKLEEDIRLIAYANAPRLMDMLRDEWQEG
jgi:hypothetical protein